MAKRGPRSTASLSSPRPTRCAIYTRKSTEEGLDQAFNSLDAQREACASYVASQRHENWTLSPVFYDDGGYSGGTMERPALRRLLADVESGQVDVVVVYKVDRLTRALSDFAKIVEVLDANGASFVSVTQAFNTTSSMGRLTLNVLLSFAQFEREVTGERIRDKIAASKKKGMWMGGPVPLGYDVVDRKLVANDSEAETVRLIFERHRQSASTRSLVAELESLGVRSKRRTMRDGRIVGGTPFSAGAITHLLRNVIYVGKIRHGEHIYPGEHNAIVDQSLWEASQAMLDGHAPRPHGHHHNLLAGRIHDGRGQKMASEHAIRRGKRYRYYVSRGTQQSDGRAWRLPAGDCEAIVRTSLIDLFSDAQRVSTELGCTNSADDFERRCDALAAQARNTADTLRLLSSLDVGIIVHDDRMEIRIARSNLMMLLGLTNTMPSDEPIRIDAHVSLRRRGHEIKLVYAAPDARPRARDPGLIQLLASGRAAYRELCVDTGRNDPTRRSHLTRLARLHFLAPDIIVAILDGRQPVELTARSLMRASQLPLDWAQQRAMLGFG